jgi:maltooligosyltrehalose trehalohydrolase
MRHARKLPIGAEVLGTAGVDFRIWAPRRRRAEVVLETDDGAVAVQLASTKGGYFSRLVAAARAGMRYRFRLDGEPTLYPDPASRFQPEGPHGPSQIVDASAFPWSDRDWQGIGPRGQVIYEMHIGTFTQAGTWEAAARQLPQLAALGVTVLEIMPLADFAGRFGWGYDGVNLFAPCRLYGAPDDVRRFVDQAHAVGLGVILDVVYNHLGPDGNYLGQFSESYVTAKYANEWGEALNFDGEASGPVREFFLANARYWIEEFHLDGLRLDATQQIFDNGPINIMAEIAQAVRAAAAGRTTLIVGENEPQDVRLVRPAQQGGYGLDALWNDDFHHSAMVALTGRSDAYYTDYRGEPQEFISALKWGYLYQGQRYQWQKKRRGTSALDLPPACFITFIQNHDQVANSGTGLRCHALTSPGRLKALTALLLLGPCTPMLFQGQEFAASSPFFFFADHETALAQLVSDGRKKFLAQFRSLAAPDGMTHIPEPHDENTFERCKLDFAERESHCEFYALHRDLLTLRRDDPAIRAAADAGGQRRVRYLDGAVLGPNAFVLRYFSADGLDRLLLVNLGRDLHLDPAPEPLLAPPLGTLWQVVWSSEDPRYGGTGTAPLDTEENWRIPGEAAVLLAPSVEEQP